jgi:ribokinase
VPIGATRHDIISGLCADRLDKNAAIAIQLTADDCSQLNRFANQGCRMSFSRIMVFGPAYLDRVLTLTHPLLPAADAPSFDQSLPAVSVEPLAEPRVYLCGPSGDALVFHLPPTSACPGMRFTLQEPVLARLCAERPVPCVTGDYTVESVLLQLGGMGAGYAKACHGVLRAPFGADETGRLVQTLLQEARIDVAPTILPGCQSDTSLIILSPRAEKLAVGVRDALRHWRYVDEDYALASKARALIFCGAPNAFAVQILGQGLSAAVMYAPSMRNIDESVVPLAALTPYIHYLAMNALEWANLADQQSCLQTIPLISVTDGARGSRVYVHGRVIDIPAVAHPAPRDTNRAGETYASTLFKALLAVYPDFPHAEIAEDVARWAATAASRQAARQLDITTFDFPADTWLQEMAAPQRS